MEKAYDYNLAELEKLNFLSLFEVHYMLIKGEEDINKSVDILKNYEYGSDIAYKKGILKALYYRETGEYDLMVEVLRKTRVNKRDSVYKKEIYYKLKQALIYTLLSEAYQYTEDVYVMRNVNKAIKIYRELFSEYVDFDEGICVPGEAIICKRTICESYLYALLIKLKNFPKYEDSDGYNHLMIQIYGVLEYIKLTQTIKMALSYAGVYLSNDYVEDNTYSPFEAMYSENVSITEPHKELLKVLKDNRSEVYYPYLLMYASKFYSIKFDNELLKYIRDEAIRLRKDYPLSILHVAMQLLSVDQYEHVEMICNDLKLEEDKYDCIRVYLLDRIKQHKSFKEKEHHISEHLELEDEIEVTPKKSVYAELLYCVKVLLSVLFIARFSLNNIYLSLAIDFIVVYFFFKF